MKESLNLVKGYRNMMNLTQEDVADVLGMTKQQYNPKELGRRPFNDKEKIILLNIFKQADPSLTIDRLFF
ncbi:helix-turn-helix transcriptional regulator [Falseniella ignava]|uniref:HTH cro/C1-type domain-containing protein n=1 Tax=Falseniella ignava CCUG 37419 TaxID=883112 RepID=K1LUR0_9LACT|nr:helix-turn-helix domain-containing protein [Falseniella ignava]EKB53733.1 hypothetical protein HMPREF9707_01486 [Falseniella ignava CCUG 37419]